MRTKISIIGAGFVGSTLAQRLAEKDLGDIVVMDIIEGIPQGKSLDIYQSAGIENFTSFVSGSNSYDDIANSSIVIITAGLARKPGMTREDLLINNARIIAHITRQIKDKAPEAILIVVTNPLDIMAQLVHKISGFPSNRVIGMAGVLDSARMRAFIAMELDVAPCDVQAMVLGGHGDSMVPLARYTTVAGVPITELMSEEQIERINRRTRDGGAEIVKLLKTGSAYYAPSSSTADMVDSILNDRKRIMPCSAMVSGQYGLENVFVGVPVKLGKNGILDIIELNLNDNELRALHDSAKIVSDNFNYIISSGEIS